MNFLFPVYGDARHWKRHPEASNKGSIGIEYLHFWTDGITDVYILILINRYGGAKTTTLYGGLTPSWTTEFRDKPSRRAELHDS